MFLFLLKQRRKSRRQSDNKSQNSRLHHNRPYHRKRRHWDAKDLASVDGRRRLLDNDRNLDNTTQRMEVLPSADQSLRPTFISAFKNPTCIRRAIRKKVLFARGFAGRAKVRSANWNEKSKVSCKNGH